MIRKSLHIVACFGLVLLAVASACAIFIRGDREFERTDISGLFIRHHAVDVGVVSNGGSFETRVEFLNRSSAPLQIESARPDCGCTTVKQDIRTILPGASANLPVTVDTQQLGAGKFLKHVLVTISDSTGRRGTVIFQVAGKIARSARLAFITPCLDFPDLERGGPTFERTAYLAGPEQLLAAFPSEIELQSPEDRSFGVSVGKAAGGQSTKPVKIRLRLNSEWSDGDFHFRIFVAQNGTKQPDAYLSVNGSVASGIVTDPAQLYFPLPVGGSTRQAQLRIHLPGSARLDDDGITSDGPLEWRITPDPNGGDRLLVSVRSRARGADAGGVYSLKISADHKKYVKNIPVHIIPLLHASGLLVEAARASGQ